MAEKSVTESSTVDVPTNSTSSPSGNPREWSDITGILQLACNDIGNDQLIRGEDFDLSCTMSILKDIEQKMNPDIIPVNYFIDEAVKKGLAPVPLSSDRTIHIQRVIDVMDHHLACEATWHDRSTVQQTICSSIYAWRLERLSSHALLESFCRVTLLICDAVIAIIQISRAYNEDLPNPYYRSSESEEEKTCLSALQAVEAAISRQLKACTAPSSKKRNFKGIEPLQTNPDFEEGLCNAVLCRLRFRKHFYRTLTCMRRPQGNGLDLARKHIDSCIFELNSMLKSEEFLRSSSSRGVVKDGVEPITTASGCQPVGFCPPVNNTLVFPAAINRGFAALTRPHAVKLLSWKEAVNHFEKLLRHLRIICSKSLCLVLEDAVRFVVDFHKYQPSWFATAQIQLLLVQDGRLYGREPIFATICKAALLPERAKNNVIQNHEIVAELGKLLVHLLRVLCVTHEYQRRFLAKALLEWGLILPQLKSAFTSKFGDLTKTPTDENVFSVKICKHILEWVAEQRHWISLRFLLLGFDLELYSSSEYCMVYWYIYVILMNLADKILCKTLLRNESMPKAREKREEVDDTEKKNDVPPEVSLLRCYMYLAKGLVTMLGFFRNEYKVFLCVGPFNSEEERFIQHFKPFQKAGYARGMSYSVFKETMDKIDFEILGNCHSFNTAQKIARELRDNFADDRGRLAELERIELVAFRNTVALNVLRQVGTADPTLNISLESGYHPHFVVATLKRS